MNDSDTPPTTAAPSVWLRPERGSRGPASRWTRDDVADAGVRVADEHGLAAVTMRSVASRLGTAGASLYRIVDSRDQLLELMADRVNGEFDYSTVGAGSGTVGMRSLARQGRAIYARHRWLLEIPDTAPVLGPNAMTYLDRALGTLSSTDLTEGAKLEVVGIVSGLVRVLALGEASPGRGRLSPEWQAAMADHLRATAVSESHPHLAAVLAADRDAADPGDGFDRVIGLVIDVAVHGSQAWE